MSIHEFLMERTLREYEMPVGRGGRGHDGRKKGKL